MTDETEVADVFTPWLINAASNYNYNQIKVLLFEDAQGDFGPYEAHLNRLGVAERPEVELIKFSKQMTLADVTNGIEEVAMQIKHNFIETGKYTLVHCYLSAE